DVCSSDLVGLSVSDLDQIILTHMHDDHMGGVNKLQEETNIPLYIHEQATLEITNGTDEAIRRKHFLDRFYEQCGLLLNTIKEIQSINYNWHNVHFLKEGDRIFAGEIGRASCRERVWRMVMYV